MAFEFRFAPLTAFYGLYTLLTLLLLRLPYWTISALVPSWRPRPSWSFSRTIKIRMLSFWTDALFTTSVSSTHVDPESVEKSGADVGLVWVEPEPELICEEILEAANINGIKPVKRAGYWYGKRGADGKVGQPAGPDEKVIYEFHGGGYVMGSAHPKWNSAGLCVELLGRTEGKGYHRAFQIEYRLAQASPLKLQGGFPAALVDAIAGYNYLVNVIGFKPENILVMGEGSGGHLALALVRYLVLYALPAIPPPRAQLLLSPTADWGNTNAGPGSSMRRNKNSDFVAAFFDGYPTRAILGSIALEQGASNVWVSPGSLRLPEAKGLFADLPQTCILAGGAEMTLDGMQTLRDRISADNDMDIVTYIEIPDAAHAVMLHKWHEPERSQAFDEVVAWIERI